MIKKCIRLSYGIQNPNYSLRELYLQWVHIRNKIKRRNYCSKKIVNESYAYYELVTREDLASRLFYCSDRFSWSRANHIDKEFKRLIENEK